MVNVIGVTMKLRHLSCSYSVFVCLHGEIAVKNRHMILYEPLIKEAESNSNRHCLLLRYTEKRFRKVVKW